MSEEAVVLWMTGLSGAGKTTLARKLEKSMREQGKRVEVLDGDDLRQKLSPELGFSEKEREAHNKRTIYLADLLSRNGVNVIVSLISPMRRVREEARERLGGRFAEVYVRCPIEVCMSRDPKGLYKRVEAGEIKNFTGIGQGYEAPESPDLVLDTHKRTEEECRIMVFEFLKKRYGHE
jgi:adenylylsulfate kinase